MSRRIKPKYKYVRISMKEIWCNLDGSPKYKQLWSYVVSFEFYRVRGAPPNSPHCMQVQWPNGLKFCFCNMVGNGILVGVMTPCGTIHTVMDRSLHIGACCPITLEETAVERSASEVIKTTITIKGMKMWPIWIIPALKGHPTSLLQTAFVASEVNGFENSVG